MTSKLSCRVNGCSGAAEKKKYQICMKHYQTLRRRGALAVSPSETLTVELPPCSFDGCTTRGAYVAGLCTMHYGRKYRNGDPAIKYSPDTVVLTADEKFWANVEKTDGCWLWTGVVDDFGKGRFVYDGKRQSAHGYAYCQAYKVTLTRRDLLRHTCGVPSCVRPDHLRRSSDIIRERTQS